MNPVDPDKLTSRQRQAVCALYEVGATPGGNEELVATLQINDLGRLYFLRDSHYSQALTRLRALGLVVGTVRFCLGRQVHCWQLTATGAQLAQQLVGGA
jgi:hypothetical protein